MLMPDAVLVHLQGAKIHRAATLVLLPRFWEAQTKRFMLHRGCKLFPGPKGGIEHEPGTILTLHGQKPLRVLPHFPHFFPTETLGSRPGYAEQPLDTDHHACASHKHGAGEQPKEEQEDQSC